jgi:rhomboid protease GluP
LRQPTDQRQAFSASITGSPATSAIVAINILFYLGLSLTGGTGTQNLLNWGAKYGPYIADGEYWRLFMPMFLHVSIFHMLTNLFGLMIFGSMVERIFGTRNFVVLYLAAGLMGNAVSFLAGPNPGVGASGAVFGILGGFGMYLLMNRRMLGQMGRQQLTSIGVIVAINVVLGLATTGIDNFAHFGGLLAGALVAYLIAPRERLYEVSTPFNFGTPRMALKAGSQPASRVVIAIVLILIIAAGITLFESQTYVTDFFGQKVPG